MESVSFRGFLHTVKEYWFLTTVFFSAAATLAYMVVFRVNPWDKHREVKQKRELVEFHNFSGHALLDDGHFAFAKGEFEEALRLNAVDQVALNGRYLCDLFLAMDSPDWDPAVGLAVQKELAKLGIIKHRKMLHIVEKYLGDLHRRISRPDLAKRHYKSALLYKPEHPDALFTLGWFHYSLDPNIKEMERCFRKMSDLNPYDYRGLHGLGYCLYMQAVRETDPHLRRQLLDEAAEQSSDAKNLGINRLNIVMDFGEIARSVIPTLSLDFHRWGSELLRDPILSQAAGNACGLDIRLLRSEGIIPLRSRDEKQAWVDFQLALDYLVLPQQPDGSHDLLLEKARKADVSGEIYKIYLDQLAILELLRSG